LDKRYINDANNDEGSTDDEDEGSLMCSSSLPLDKHENNGKRKVLASANIGFREQLLRISTASKRKKLSSKFYRKLPYGRKQ
jgi:hypothetical protein